MCPHVVAKSKPQLTPSKLQIAKLWILLIGVNQYSDVELPSLRYSALDCQGLGEALTEATVSFSAREVIVHHDFADSKPVLNTVRNSLEKVLTSAKSRDTILFYFSGHGILDAESQQVYLCLRDTRKDNLRATGLPLQEILQRLGNTQASQQLVWLDACHSGGMTLRGTNEAIPNPTKQLVKALQIKAQQSKGFYALLSCDQTQQSWEFPELGHGVFTYYLMKGLRGEAADFKGIIEADALYHYVYHQTLRYIDRSNQQIRLLNQQKSSRSQKQLHSEYPLQTPKRIVEGFGRVVIGKQQVKTKSSLPRRALVIDGLGNTQTTIDLSKLLGGRGRFELEYFRLGIKQQRNVRDAIISCLQTTISQKETTTAFLYLRGKIKYGKGGETWLVFRDGEYISREWLRKVLQQSSVTQKIVVLDFLDSQGIAEWVEELKSDDACGMCIIASSFAPEEIAKPKQTDNRRKNLQQFSQGLVSTLQKNDPENGLSVATWISQLQIELAGSNLNPHIWLSGTRGIIEVLPAKKRKSQRNNDSTIYDINVCPYMGLQPFSEDNSQYFYGREALLQKLLNRLTHHNTLAVVGASGSGKSSLVQAGLFEKLKQGTQIPQSDRWLLRCFRPGSNPLESLAECLMSGEIDPEKNQKQMRVTALLERGVEGFVQWLRTRPEPMVVLAVDQFEELFTLTSEVDRNKFISLLLKTIEYCGDRFCLIFLIRADFVATCLEIPELSPILQQKSVLIPSYFSESDYRDAILKPAKQVGLKVEPSLVEVLLQETQGGTGDLSLLQFILQKLWENRQRGYLTFKAYKELGGIRGALEQQAQELYDSLDEKSKECAKWIFLNLTKIGDGTKDSRRRITKSDLMVDKYPSLLIERTLQKLTAAKLVITNLSHNTPTIIRSSKGLVDDNRLLQKAMYQEATIEVVHEILIEHWTTLRRWLSEDRSRLQLQRQIEEAALLWQKSDRQSEFLLKGLRLAEAEEIYLKDSDELTNTARDFLAICIEAKLKKKKEATKVLRLTQVTAVVLGVLGITTTTFAGLIYRQKLITQVENIQLANTTSEALLLSNRTLDSLAISLQAGQKLQQINGLERKLINNPQIDTMRIETIELLQNSINTIQGFNSFANNPSNIDPTSELDDLIIEGCDLITNSFKYNNIIKIDDVCN